MDTLGDTSVDTLGRQCENQDLGGAKRALSAQIALLTKLYNELEKILISYDNMENVKQLYGKLCDRFEEFKSEHLLCLDLCAEPGAANELEQSFDRYATTFAQFQDTQWISGQNRPMLEDNDGCLSVSHVSSRTSSTIMTSRSKLQAAQAKRILAEHKLRLLSEKHEIQRAQRELEIKQELLEQRCELEEASLEESVWRQAVNEDATDLVNVKPVIHLQYLCDISRDCSTVKNEMCSDQESTPTSQILVRPESSQKNEQGKSSTNSPEKFGC